MFKWRLARVNEEAEGDSGEGDSGEGDAEADAKAGDEDKKGKGPKDGVFFLNFDENCTLKGFRAESAMTKIGIVSAMAATVAYLSF